MPPAEPAALPLLPLATALGVGLLVGAVRERRKPEPAIIAGLRTHALVALSATVALWLDPLAFVAVLVLVGVFAAMSYRRSREACAGGRCWRRRRPARRSSPSGWPRTSGAGGRPCRGTWRRSGT